MTQYANGERKPEPRNQQGYDNRQDDQSENHRNRKIEVLPNDLTGASAQAKHKRKLAEVIRHKHNVRCLQGNIRSGPPHRYAKIGRRHGQAHR